MIRLVLVSIFFSFSCFAQVIETATTAEALAHADSDTLLIFDLDNTIVMPAQTLGGEEWFDYLVEEDLKKGTEKSVAIERALKIWNQVMLTTKVVPAEKSAPEQIAAKQRAGTKTMALTARPPELAAVTHKQLNSVGIHLDKNTVTKETVTVAGVEPAPFKRGVMFVGAQNNKGDILVKFLNALNLKPKKIVFVDNKQKHVDAVEKALAGSGIDYVGCRLGVTDAKIAAFDTELADIQLQYFKGILSDSAADAIRNAGVQ